MKSSRGTANRLRRHLAHARTPRNLLLVWDPIIGLGLAGVTLLCIVALFSVTAALVPRLPLAPEGSFISGPLARPTVVAVSIVNPVFEEPLACNTRHA